MSDVIQALGGLGLFLLGKSIMTDGLKAVADERLRGLLVPRTANGPCSRPFIPVVMARSVASNGGPSELNFNLGCLPA